MSRVDFRPLNANFLTYFRVEIFVIGLKFKIY